MSLSKCCWYEPTLRSSSSQERQLNFVFQPSQANHLSINRLLQNQIG